jgi:hypothetical protein
LECSDDEEDEEENFFRRERFSPARVRWRGAEATDHAFPFLFPGFPFLGGHEVEESINIERPPSFHPKRNFFRWAAMWSSVEGRDFDGVEPEALRELTAGATGRRRIGRLQVDGAFFEIDGVEPEVSDGSQAPMNGLRTGNGPMRGL